MSETGGHAEVLYTNARLATLAGGAEAGGYGIVEDGAIAVDVTAAFVVTR